MERINWTCLRLIFVILLENERSEERARKSESWHGEYKINKAFLPGFGHTRKGRLHSSSSDPCQTHGSDFRDQLLSATDLSGAFSLFLNSRI